MHKINYIHDFKRRISQTIGISVASQINVVNEVKWSTDYTRKHNEHLSTS